MHPKRVQGMHNAAAVSLRVATRTLVNSRSFFVVAALILGVGIAAATIMFSFVDGIVLRPLPFASPDRLVLVWDSVAPYRYTAPADFLDWRRMTRSFDALAAFEPVGLNLAGGGEPERLQALSVSGNFFAVLGADALRGRTFALSDEGGGGGREAVLGERLWRRRFGASPDAIGATIRLNDRPYTIVGVMPAAFEFFQPVDLWTLAERGIPGEFAAKDIRAVRDSRFFYAVARLNQGVSLREAEAEMLAISQRLAAAFPDTNAGQIAHVQPLRAALVGDVRQRLLVLLAAVACLLLLACVNVANLLLGRAVGRRREIAMRIALGATRRHLLRQFLEESFVLSSAATTIGVLIAVWGVDGVKALAPAGTPRLSEVTIDLRVLAFSAALAIATGVLFGLAPAIHLMRQPADAAALRPNGARTTDATGGRSRNALAAGEIALAEILLVAAGLVLASFVRLTAVNPGFTSERMLTFTVALPPARYPAAAARTRFFQDLLGRLEALPGVARVGAALALPIVDGRVDRGVWIEGQPSLTAGGGYHVDFQLVNDRYFQTLQIPLVEGRTFGDDDDLGAPSVAIVSAAMARKYWPGEDPIGRRIGLGDSSSPGYWRTIVGVVGDVRQQALAEPATAQVYVPLTQNRESWNTMQFAMRLDGGLEGVANAVRAQVAAIDGDQPVTKMQMMTRALSDSTRAQRFNLWLLGLFAAVALVLATTGVYAVRASAVAARAHEVGIRIALGATPGQIVRLVTSQALTPTFIGITVGLAAALAVGKAMRGLLFEVAPYDPATLALAVTVLFSTSLAASWIPARRAAKVDPATALKRE